MRGVLPLKDQGEGLNYLRKGGVKEDNCAEGVSIILREAVGFALLPNIRHGDVGSLYPPYAVCFAANSTCGELGRIVRYQGVLLAVSLKLAWVPVHLLCAPPARRRE